MWCNRNKTSYRVHVCQAHVFPISVLLKMCKLKCQEAVNKWEIEQLLNWIEWTHLGWRSLVRVWLAPEHVKSGCTLPNVKLCVCFCAYFYFYIKVTKHQPQFENGKLGKCQIRSIAGGGGGMPGFSFLTKTCTRILCPPKTRTLITYLVFSVRAM